jgi:hypothetical protein
MIVPHILEQYNGLLFNGQNAENEECAIQHSTIVEGVIMKVS